MNKKKKKILITGGLGFIGINTALSLSKLGYECYVVDNFFRIESKLNKNLIKNNPNIIFFKHDITNFLKTHNLFSENNFFAVLNFAGQVAMDKSIMDPVTDFKINAVGSLSLLEAIRKNNQDTIYLFTSTNKVYGDLSWDKLIEYETRFESKKFKNGYPNDLPLKISTPYGCSKGTADLYTKDYFNTFGIKTIVFRLSTIYGQNQLSTYNQGWIGWFTKQALIKKNKSTIQFLGNGKQVRDVLFIDDLVNLFQKVISDSEAFIGNSFNVGGGYQNSVSLIELIQYLESITNKNFIIRTQKPRNSDQKYYVSDISKIQKITSWEPRVDKFQGILKNYEFIKNTL